jgi:hypothetical protein
MSLPPAISRANARVRPSGEKAGESSPTDAAGGKVSRCFSPVSISSRKILKGSPAAAASATARYFPSGE